MTRLGTFVCTTLVGASFTVSASFAQESSLQVDITEFKDPPICSSFEPSPESSMFGCEVSPIDEDEKGIERNIVKIKLKAQTKTINIGGIDVKTENYGTYLPPVVEARAEDTVAVDLENTLGQRVGDSHHYKKNENPTNLHYFHGGIVPPNNGNSYKGKSARMGTGDNIYSYVERGDNIFNYVVPIPGIRKLNARVLESDGMISHLPGLNWYHSHLHGLSSDQVMGGMSGLLSVGKRDENLRAKCDDSTSDACKKKTEELKKNTIVKYGLLRDISLKKDADDLKWIPDPSGQNFTTEASVCGVLGEDGVTFDTDRRELRKGFCRRSKDDDKDAVDHDKLWLFTINGQKFPTI